MLYSYTELKVNTYYMVVVYPEDYDEEDLALLSSSAFRYDIGSLSQRAYFMFDSKNEMDNFVQKFDIQEVSTLDELIMLRKMEKD